MIQKLCVSIIALAALLTVIKVVKTVVFQRISRRGKTHDINPVIAKDPVDKLLDSLHGTITREEAENLYFGNNVSIAKIYRLWRAKN